MIAICRALTLYTVMQIDMASGLVEPRAAAAALAVRRATARLTAGSGNADFMRGTLQTGRYYADQLLLQAQGLAWICAAGRASVSGADEALR